MPRTGRPKSSDNRVRAGVLILVRLIVVGWVVAGFLRAQFGAGHHRPSAWFWAGLALLMSSTTALEWRERGHFSREAALELAIAERTADLEKERRREQDRVRILEMLVLNKPLTEVLETILRHVAAQCGDVACIVAERHGDACRAMAAFNAPLEWLTALQAPGGAPFEVWRNAVLCVNLQDSPAWRPLMSRLHENIPVNALCRPIRCRHGQSAALILLYPGNLVPGPRDTRTAEVAGRLARLAIEQSRLYESLHYQAHHDSLTGLPNRLLFAERLDSFIHEASAEHRMAILFVDLDLFKKVNDTFSHRVGDLFLREIACRMRNVVRPSDMVARIGGDEFTILVGDIKNPAEVTEIAARLLEEIRRPVHIEDREITSSASVGIAIYPEDGSDAETLQRAADAAMYLAKDSGRDRAEAFSARGELLDKLRMEEELRVALRDGHFVVHYQPKVRADRSPAGFEALIRLEHPVWGRMAPMTFIPEAESSGLIVPIGFWVLDEVCRQIAEWESQGVDPISVAVNVSAVQMCRGDFARSVADCLRLRGVDASRLEIEITESLMIDADGATQEQLKALRALGVRLTIDDFGTGYSSLSYLHKLPIDAIKLDKSFVQTVDSDHLAHRLVRAMIGVAEGLGLEVVAEGVETEEQRRVLVDAGCVLMQGYLFSKPHAASDLGEFLLAQQSHDPIAMTRDLVQLSTISVPEDRLEMRLGHLD